MKTKAPGRLLWPFGITQLVMIAAVGTALWLAYDPWRWGKVRNTLRQNFPATAHIDGGTLADWIANPAHQPPLILDIRSPAEFGASRLPGARNLNPADIPAALGPEVKPDTPILVYCTVGLDSAAVVAGLSRRGYKRVQYLEGGIYQWANDARPLTGPAAPKVRPSAANAEHAGLLKRRVRAD